MPRLAEAIMDSMATIPLNELKSTLDDCLKRVQGGEDLFVTQAGVPVARITRIVRSSGWSPELRGLIDAGVVTPPEKPMDLEFLQQEPAIADPQGHVLSALLDEREHGR